jgi:hypothetical protein
VKTKPGVRKRGKGDRDKYPGLPGQSLAFLNSAVRAGTT